MAGMWGVKETMQLAWDYVLQIELRWWSEQPVGNCGPQLSIVYLFSISCLDSVNIIVVTMTYNTERAGEGLGRACIGSVVGLRSIYVSRVISCSVTWAFKPHPRTSVDRQRASKRRGCRVVGNIWLMWWLHDDERGQQYDGS